MSRRTKTARNNRPIRRWLWRLFWLTLLSFVLVQLWFFVQVWHLRDHNPETTAFMRERLEMLRGIRPDIRANQIFVPIDAISPAARRAVVASEDDRFMDHFGIDLKGLRRAMERNIEAGGIVEGGSTITQQLAKNLFLSADQSLWRKGEEALIALMLEATLGKRRILELYLNYAEWGNLVYGIEAAARIYYGKSASQLTRYEAAKLAAMLPNPRFYQDNRNARGLQVRTSAVLERMEYSRTP
ncbi:monofunctional biosynthetic peptidoglycan transglycosylase [Guyparkeria hydrothermalis]|uniref:monofunctional biosynthetic peptidoglycan transglycosylase n=1 Tax=Guyparkeria hydrothermalis TaxID=923 RepID=UPI002021946D|nr:monofunctional biosynthetic peptidoglycan transglycosylase [Guyparkeria hydrothermalis]MCL7744751.1 monofunctional biosynthetic peptidoglycan transglycosylase [Guyparkeria hydrothermalis]